MYVCMYVCMYISVCVYVHVCDYVRMYVCMHACTHICAYVCMHIYMYECMYIYVCIYVCGAGNKRIHIALCESLLGLMRITLANWLAKFLGHCESVSADCYESLLLMNLQKDFFFDPRLFLDKSNSTN